MKKQLYSGMCKCGHSINSHHSCCIVNAEFCKNNSWVAEQNHNYYDECLICNGVNGGEGEGDRTGKFCNSYKDILEPEGINIDVHNKS